MATHEQIRKASQIAAEMGSDAAERKQKHPEGESEGQEAFDPVALAQSVHSPRRRAKADKDVMALVRNVKGR